MNATIPSGIETTGLPEEFGNGDGSALTMPGEHLRLCQVQLYDQTDHVNELVNERSWLLHPSERELRLRGNLFVIEDILPRTGWIAVRRAPLPHARSDEDVPDLLLRAMKGRGFRFEFACSADGDWAFLPFQGGVVERMRVLQAWQRSLRPDSDAHRVPRLLTNTWGDRSRDSRISEDFIAREIRAARRLGADIVQIDDGWQRGVTANSAEASQRGGVWEGFWNANHLFWHPHPERLPRGLEPLLAQARAARVDMGLWFAPDSWNEFANWRRDADCLLDLFRRLGIRFFKVDGINALTCDARRNLRRFFDAVLKESDGKIALDLDITAQLRPGYFGAIDAGPLFLENRYSDWHNYWPHHTFRNLWKLAPWVAPSRLRMEFLNNSRNLEQYADDPLAPAFYAPDALFATVMFANPLGWFEVSNLPAAYFKTISPLVRVWKECRREIAQGTIIPIGAEPDGLNWSGLLSISDDYTSGYAVIFRPLGPLARCSFSAPLAAGADYACSLLAGSGRCSVREGGLNVEIPRPLDYLFVKLEKRRRAGLRRSGSLMKGARNG